MPYNIRIVSTYPPRRCGIGTFSRDLANALEHFTGEIGHIRIAAIDKDKLPYSIPVDLVIDQYDTLSWVQATQDIVTRAKESENPTVVLLQHEYGLDPDTQGNDCRGRNFVNMARALNQKGLTTFVYLHTVLEQPDDHQRQTIVDLATHTDGLIVTTESAIHILESSSYGIEHAKLKHIDHGIRMSHPSQYDRLEIKKRLGLDDRFLVTTVGLLSPGKGIEFGIRAFGLFLSESCSPAQRKKVVYLVAGQAHPDFVKADNGRPYQNYCETIKCATKQSGLKHITVKDLPDPRIKDYELIFLDRFIDEPLLLDLYGATNAMLLPYLGTEQISSGILADTVGSGRVAIATKFRYALELLLSNRPGRTGLMIGRYARGILVDPGEPSVEQIAQALDYLVFSKDKRLKMERQAHQRGYQMSWNNSAWALLQHVDFISEEKEIVTGRGLDFVRENASVLQRHRTIKQPKPVESP